MSTPMSTRLRDYRILWRAAVSHANPFDSVIIRWGSGSIGIALGALVWRTEGLRGMAAMAWWMTCGAVLLIWMSRFMPGAVRLNSPTNAKLVPGMRRRLVELACVAWLVPMGALALAPYPAGASFVIWLFGIAVISLGIALTTSGHRAGASFLFAACFGPLLISQVPHTHTVGEWLSRPPIAALALLLYAGLGILTVRQVLPEGGERHWRMEAKRARVLDAAGKGEVVIDKLANKHAKGWYAASLRRDSVRRDGKRLVLHALGPGVHLGEFVVGLAYMTAIAAGIRILMTWRADPIEVDTLGWVLAFMVLVAVPLIHCVRIGQLSAGLAGEQALVRLAPAMPAGAEAFNRRLGRALLRQVLTVWGLSAGTAVLLAALGGAGIDALLRVASLACLALPVVAIPLRDHAGRRHSAAAAAARLLLISLVGSLLLALAVSALTNIPVLPVAALASIGFTAAAVLRGLGTMRRAPCAFPAGRMD